jgi:hypothetical protein
VCAAILRYRYYDELRTGTGISAEPTTKQRRKEERKTMSILFYTTEYFPLVSDRSKGKLETTLLTQKTNERTDADDGKGER